MSQGPTQEMKRFLLEEVTNWMKTYPKFHNKNTKYYKEINQWN